ncbi:MAG TPA: hypothetical protein PKH07_20540, partial [bacterium]|nr:hypothetical protein [bacterium]
IIGNVGTWILFRLGIRDARVLNEALGEQYDVARLANLPNYQTFVRPMVHGKPLDPFFCLSLPPLPENRDNKSKALISKTLKTLGRPRVEVNDQILKTILNLSEKKTERDNGL